MHETPSRIGRRSDAVGDRDMPSFLSLSFCEDAVDAAVHLDPGQSLVTPRTDVPSAVNFF